MPMESLSSGNAQRMASEDGLERDLGSDITSQKFDILGETTSGDEEAMGRSAGDPYTAADDRVIAKYIANFDEWDNLTTKQKWASFCERVNY